MNKIRSGQAYLYRQGGLKSTVFEIRMKSKIRGDLLRRAFEKSLIRYPYLKSKLVEKNGDFYITENILSVAFAKTDKYRSLGSMSVNYHLIDVTYTDNKIRVAFHHALCDGKGIKPFLETLIYYYCCLKYNRTFASKGIRLAGEPLLLGETTEPFGTSKYEAADTKMPEVIKDGYVLPEHNEEVTKYFRYEVNIKHDEFMKVAKENNATPAILLSLLCSKAIKELHPNADKPIVCSMASDMRKELDLENTHKNCVSSLYLPYTKSVEELSLKEQAEEYRKIIKEQRHPDVVKNMVNAQIGLSEMLDQKDKLAEKQQMLSFFNNICINTYVISYIGQIQLDECEKYVDSIHLYSSGNKGLILNMVSAGEYFTVDFLQSFESESIFKQFIKMLEENGLKSSVSEKIEFNTTPDKTFATGKWQAERFYSKLE